MPRDRELLERAPQGSGGYICGQATPSLACRATSSPVAASQDFISPI